VNNIEKTQKNIETIIECTEIDFINNIRLSIKDAEETIGLCQNAYQQLLLYKTKGFNIKFYYNEKTHQYSFVPYKTQIGFKYEKPKTA
jgi:hypothetical protein